MKPILLAIAASLVAGMGAGAAIAETGKDGAVQVSAGMWNWRQKTSVLGMTVSDKKSRECMIPEKASMTLSKLAYDLDESCRVDNVATAPGGYNFKLICGGKYPGKADANINHTSRSLAMRAKGSVRWNGIPAGFSWKADATYAGECTPEEAARQKAKWDAEQAELAAQ